VVTTKYLAKKSKDHNSVKNHWTVNLICNLSLYTHIPNIKSISQSIAKKKWSQLFYFGIADMGNTICPSRLVAGT